MVRERGDGEDWGWLEGVGKGREEGWIWVQGRIYFNKGVILGFTGDVIINGIPGPRRDPQIVLWTEERVPELALAHNHTDEYFAYHHRSFSWRWMEMETETHIGTLDLTP